MPTLTEAQPRSLESYEKWFQAQTDRFYRPELKDLMFAVDIFHYFRLYPENGGDIIVKKRFGKDHKVHRISYNLTQADVANAQRSSQNLQMKTKIY